VQGFLIGASRDGRNAGRQQGTKAEGMNEVICKQGRTVTCLLPLCIISMLQAR
jgi:hypothetical protein